MMKTFAELINANEVVFAKNLHQLVKLEEATLNSAKKVKLFVKKHTHTNDCNRDHCVELEKNAH